MLVSQLLVGEAEKLKSSFLSRCKMANGRIEQLLVLAPTIPAGDSGIVDLDRRTASSTSESEGIRMGVIAWKNAAVILDVRPSIRPRLGRSKSCCMLSGYTKPSTAPDQAHCGVFSCWLRHQHKYQGERAQDSSQH